MSQTVIVSVTYVTSCHVEQSGFTESKAGFTVDIGGKGCAQDSLLENIILVNIIFFRVITRQGRVK
jgi:hypothetical protein